MSVIATQLQQLYVTYFNRPADAAGLEYWTGAAAQGVSMDTIAASFAASAEFKALYGGKPSAELVKAAYMNLFGRAAEDAGVVYWSGVIDAGNISAHDAVSVIVRGATGADLDVSSNKVAAAMAYTAALDAPEKIAAYGSAASLAAAVAWLKGVTHAASLDLAKAALSDLVDQMVVARLAEGNAGKTGTLDIVVDSVTHTLKISGTATGDIGMVLDVNNVATFTRGGVTASVRPDMDDVAAIAVVAGQVLRATAAHLSGKSVTGHGAVVATALQVTPDANLNGIVTDKVIALAALSDDTVALTGNPGKAQVLVHGSGTLNVAPAPGKSATFVVDTGAILAGPADALSGVVISGSGLVRVSGVTAATNLSKVHVAELEAVLAKNTDLSGAIGLETVTRYVIDKNATLTLTAEQADHTDLSGMGNVVVTGSTGSQTIHVSQTGDSALSGGSGADMLELSAGRQTLKYSFGAAEFGGKSDSTASAMDTVRNFQVGVDQIQLFDSTGAALVAPVSLVRLADVDGTRIRSSGDFNDVVFKTTYFSRDAMVAGLVNVIGGAYEGTYMHVRRPSSYFGDYESDVFIKFTGVSGSGPVGPLNVLDFFLPLADRVAPTVKITKLAYWEDTGKFRLYGSDFQTMLSPGEDSRTDVKARLDWSKLVWDIDGDGGTTADVTFKPSDIKSAYMQDDGLTIELTEAKNAALTATPGYAFSGKNIADKLDVTAGFIKDRTGNAAITDGMANGELSTSTTLTVSAGKKAAPVTAAAVFWIADDSSSADGAYVDFSGVTSGAILVDIMTGGTVTLAHINHSSWLDVMLEKDTNFVVTSSSLNKFTTGNGNDRLVSTSTGAVTFYSRGGADVMTGGAGGNTYLFSAANDFKSTSVADLLAAADTITNWEAASADKIDFFYWTTLGTTEHGTAAAPGRASISAGGLAAFDATDATLSQKLAAVVTTVGTDSVGTSVVFNNGSDAYLFVVGNKLAGVQAGDALIKLVGVSASQISFSDGCIVGF